MKVIQRRNSRVLLGALLVGSAAASLCAHAPLEQRTFDASSDVAHSQDLLLTADHHTDGYLIPLKTYYQELQALAAQRSDDASESLATGWWQSWKNTVDLWTRSWRELKLTEHVLSVAQALEYVVRAAYDVQTLCAQQPSDEKALLAAAERYAVARYHYEHAQGWLQTHIRYYEDKQYEEPLTRPRNVAAAATFNRATGSSFAQLDAQTVHHLVVAGLWDAQGVRDHERVYFARTTGMLKAPEW